MPSIRVRVPATTANLGPGFDALGLALQLHNFVSLEEAPDGVDEIIAQGEGAQSLNEGSCEKNIALIAARALLQHLRGKAPALRLTLENSIPLARGLGSSSAARVGALVAANEWARQNWGGAADNSTLLALATQLEGHPDNVAPALLGGLVVCATQESHDAGEMPTVQALRVPADFPRLVVFIPESELETKEARAVLPDVIFRKDATFNLARASLLTATLAGGAWRRQPDLLRESLKDKLHQDLRASLMPGYTAACLAAIEAGALGATLSGAGPSIMAWLPDDEALIPEVCTAMQDAAANSEVFGKAREIGVDTEGCAPLTS